MTNRVTYTVIALLPIILMIAAFYSYPHIYAALIESMGTPVIGYPPDMFRITFFFSINAALIPLAILLVWSFGNMNDKKRRIISVTIILLGAFAGYISRFLLIRWSMTYVTSDTINPNVINMVNINSFLFERYMLYGLIAGALIAFLSLKKRRNTITE
jgi:hypothetical protein